MEIAHVRPMAAAASPCPDLNIRDPGIEILLPYRRFASMASRRCSLALTPPPPEAGADRPGIVRLCTLGSGIRFVEHGAMRPRKRSGHVAFSRSSAEFVRFRVNGVRRNRVIISSYSRSSSQLRARLNYELVSTHDLASTGGRMKHVTLFVVALAIAAPVRAQHVHDQGPPPAPQRGGGRRRRLSTSHGTTPSRPERPNTPPGRSRNLLVTASGWISRWPTERP